MGIFKIALCLIDWYIFMWQSLEVLNVFNTLTLKQIFWITKTFFKKLESCFLVESTKIENASFPYKTAISETSVKNRRGNIKWTYHKEQSLLLFFWKFCFSLRTSCKELIWCMIYPNAHIHTFHKRWSFIQWRFSLWVSVSFVPVFDHSANAKRNF